MTQRRYDEAEVAAIFQRAAEAPPPGASVGTGDAARGLTLAELQEIGRDVGISAGAIAQAARTMDLVGPSTSRTFLGLPIGVSHTVYLDRRLSDEVWERLVVDLRETFDARGRVTSQGSLRQWTNGNLQALLEPTAAGHRIRLRTLKRDAISMLAGGLAMVGFSVVSLIASAATSAAGEAGIVMNMGLLGFAGAGMFTVSAFRLPRWARTRRRQMEAVAARAALMAQVDGTPDSDPRRPEAT